MASNYQDITAGLMEVYMMQVGAVETDVTKYRFGPSRCEERVYERQITSAKTGKEYPFKLRIYSSIDKRTDGARGKGKDAIRIGLVDEDGQAVFSEKRVNRVGKSPEDVMERMVARCREVYRHALDPNNYCDRCGKGMMVRRKRKKDGKPFMACSQWKKTGCNNIVNIPAGE